MGKPGTDAYEATFARILQMLSFGLSVHEIRDALLASGLSETDAYLCFTAAKMLAADSEPAL